MLTAAINDIRTSWVKGGVAYSCKHDMAIKDKSTLFLFNLFSPLPPFKGQHANVILHINGVHTFEYINS
jgi:hypothetical protein